MKIKIPDSFKGKKYIGLFDSWEQFITDDGYQYYGTTLVASNNLENIRLYMQTTEMMNFHKGYIWDGVDINDHDPMLLVTPQIDEERNVRTYILELVPYIDVRDFIEHTWKAINLFRDVAGIDQSHNCLNEVVLSDDPPEN